MKSVTGIVAINSFATLSLSAVAQQPAADVSLEAQNLGDTHEYTFNDAVEQRNEYCRNFGRLYTLGVRCAF